MCYTKVKESLNFFQFLWARSWFSTFWNIIVYKQALSSLLKKQPDGRPWLVEMLICSGKQNCGRKKRQLLNKTLKRNRSEESGEIETFNLRKIIMTEWKIIFIPSYFRFKYWKLFYGLELLPSQWIIVLDRQLLIGVISSLTLRLLMAAKELGGEITWKITISSESLTTNPRLLWLPLEEWSHCKPRKRTIHRCGG